MSIFCYNYSMDRLEMLKIAENQDCEAIWPEDLQQEVSLKEKYTEFYDDIKQPSKYIKEDW